MDIKVKDSICTVFIVLLVCYIVFHICLLMGHIRSCCLLLGGVVFVLLFQTNFLIAFLFFPQWKLLRIV